MFHIPFELTIRHSPTTPNAAPCNAVLMTTLKPLPFVRKDQTIKLAKCNVPAELIKGLFTWKEGALANRATQLEGLKHSPPLHATHLTRTVSGLHKLSLERPLSTTT